MQIRIVQEHGAEAAESGRPRPSFDLVVVDLGKLAGEAGQLCILVELRLPAVGDRGGQTGARNLGDGPVDTPRQLLRQAVVARVWAPSLDKPLGVRRGHVDLGMEALAGA